MQLLNRIPLCGGSIDQEVFQRLEVPLFEELPEDDPEVLSLVLLAPDVEPLVLVLLDELDDPALELLLLRFMESLLLRLSFWL